MREVAITMLWNSCDERAEILAEYVINTGATVRAAAAHFGVSKSTIHKDLTQKLPKINRSLYNNVKEVLDLNKSERHLRGGEATRKKYLKIKLNNDIFILKSKKFR